MTLDEIHKWAEITQAAVSAVAVIVAGFWAYLVFVRERRRFPQAVVEHEVHAIVVGENLFVRANVKIRNVGSMLLTADQITVRVQKMFPMELSAPPPNQLSEPDFDWPILSCRQIDWPQGTCEIEPNESQPLPFDFIIGDKPTMIQIYSYVRNSSKRNRPIGWRHATVHNVLEIEELHE